MAPEHGSVIYTFYRYGKFMQTRHNSIPEAVEAAAGDFDTGSTLYDALWNGENGEQLMDHNQLREAIYAKVKAW